MTVRLSKRASIEQATSMLTHVRLCVAQIQRLAPAILDWNILAMQSYVQPYPRPFLAGQSTVFSIKGAVPIVAITTSAESQGHGTDSR